MSASMHGEDRRSVAVRLAVMQYVLAVVFAALAVAFWVFQVAQHAKFRELAENNHLRALPLRAPRGIIFDRHGRVLVENRYSYTIAVVREQTPDLGATLRTLAAATGVPEERLREALRRRAREPAYRPIPVIEDATDAQLASVIARRLELPGVVVEQIPTRRYPPDAMAAHLFGYVGEVTEAQLARAEFAGLRSGAIVGQAGLEQRYNALLMGRDGTRYVKVNSLGREIGSLKELDLEPVEGRRLRLTIDYDIQRAVEEGFRRSGYRGAAVVLDPRNGDVLALVSLPAFDPNRFAVGIEPAAWQALNSDRAHPLQNRALQGRYSPGSTFKIAVAVAALEEGVVTPETRVHCSGGATFYGRYFRCWRKGGHGSVDLRRALEQSCNVYFYTVGNLLGVDRIHRWATLLGLGVRSGIDLPNEVEGLVPSSQWKRERFGEKWYAGETISVAIGQGQVWVTPISLAVMAMTVANGGTRYAPRVIQAVDDGHGWKPVPPPPPRSAVALSPSTLEAVRDGLWLVVNGAGTGGRARIPGRDVAGKTGTAQVISLQGGQRAAGRTDRDLRDHGWFVFFAPRDHPEIAGVVLTEHSEHGYLSAPIAKFAMETYFAKQEGRPLPVWPEPAAPPVVVAAAGGGAGGGR
jgi:penicillin-binding protein 2